MQSMTSEDVRKLIYTSRQLNTLPYNPLTVFNCVVLCLTSQMDMVADEMKRCYDNVSRAYWCNRASTSASSSGIYNDRVITSLVKQIIIVIVTGTALGMLSSISGIIIGHFSIDGKVQSSHFNSQQAISNFFEVNENTTINPPSDLYRILVEKYSFSGQTVLDCLSEGKC